MMSVRFVASGCSRSINCALYLDESESGCSCMRTSSIAACGEAASTAVCERVLLQRALLYVNKQPKTAAAPMPTEGDVPGPIPVHKAGCGV
eukprot:scaffold229526_cov17-Tisochrysis_lutea.AAC.2